MFLRTTYTLIGLLLLVPMLVIGQTTRPWNGKKCAVALTYDDALQGHLDQVIPALDALGLKGTFYLSAYFPGFINNTSRWAAVAKKGHELGNHTLFHPCAGDKPGREWVNPTYDLSKYTLKRMTDEINMTNVVLKTLDGKSVRTFAYPCGDTKVGEEEYYKTVSNAFVAARGVRSELEQLKTIDLANVNAYGMSGQTGEEMIALVKKAQESNAMIVFLFHGVGGGHSLNVDLAEHAKLLRYLKQQASNIWVAPFIDLAQYAKAHAVK